MKMDRTLYATHWQDAAIPFRGRKKLRKAIRNIAIGYLSKLDRKQDQRFLRCVAAHYVFDNQIEDFRSIVKQLKELGRFVDTQTCYAMLRGEKEIDDKYLHLSFDDGFRNVFTNALPILKEEQVPAIIFVPTNWISASPNEARRFSVEIAKYRSPVEMANWDDLARAQNDGFDIGSHTRTHPRLTDLDANDIYSEITKSKADLEDRLGKQCRFFAYPFGKPGDYNKQTLTAVKDAGYQAAFGIHRGRVIPGKTNPFLIPRHHIEPEWPMSHIRYFVNGNKEAYWDRKLTVR